MKEQNMTDLATAGNIIVSTEDFLATVASMLTKSENTLLVQFLNRKENSRFKAGALAQLIADALRDDAYRHGS
jgi:light-regulated signal transduction histidine kinase (bacteriophytochrome)